MKRHKKKKHSLKVTATDYIKAIRKGNREAQLEESAGWKAVEKPHENKKAYNRKRDKKVPDIEE